MNLECFLSATICEYAVPQVIALYYSIAQIVISSCIGFAKIGLHATVISTRYPKKYVSIQQNCIFSYLLRVTYFLPAAV